MTEKTGRVLSIVLFIVGVLTAFLFAGSILWANFELPFYFDYSYASIRSQDQGEAELNCPILLTQAETGVVSTDIFNRSDKTITPTLRGEISYWGGITREFEFKPTILPGESSPIEVMVDAEDIVFKFMILVRTYQLPTYKTPAQAGSCAIVMLPITFLTGEQVYMLSLASMLLFLSAGLYLWKMNSRSLQGKARKVFNVMVTLTLLLLGAVLSGIAGEWLPGIAFMILIVLLTMVAIVYFGTGPEDNKD